MYSFIINQRSYNYHIRVIDVRSYAKDPVHLTLAKNLSYSQETTTGSPYS